MKQATVLLLLVVLCGCRSEEVGTAAPRADYLSAVASLELDPSKYSSFQKYWDSVLGRMESWLKGISDPEELKALLYDCQAKHKAQPEAPWDRRKWICPYFESRNLIMYRLAEIRSEEAARILVELFCDPSVGWDAHASETAGDAIVKCGKPALPFLREKQDSDDHIAFLIKQIESGAKTGF